MNSRKRITPSLKARKKIKRSTKSYFFKFREKFQSSQQALSLKKGEDSRMAAGGTDIHRSRHEEVMYVLSALLKAKHESAKISVSEIQDVIADIKASLCGFMAQT